MNADPHTCHALSDTDSAYTDAVHEAIAPPRVDIDEDTVGKGLAQLVLTVVRLLHELLEKQAIRRMEAGSLTEEEIDRLGRTLRAQSDEIRDMAARFGLRVDDLNLDLGPLGKVL